MLQTVEISPLVLEVTATNVVEAYREAEVYTVQGGFEVSTPKSLDGGETFTFTVDMNDRDATVLQ